MASGATDPRPITSLLVANRGEIACRVARTARRLGMATVGVYTDSDRNALHVDAVDVAVRIESYLDIDAILAAAERLAADAVHPGYGFLAENADFAEAVAAAGLTWVGPTPGQIRLLGDKIAAKRAAVEAGVPTTEALTIDDGGLPTDLPPFPLLVKAAAGGGGRGMRVVGAPAELADAVESARREATAAFGDGTVFIEPFIERGRHIEVQIFGDTHGNVVHLGERECSIQRRNQKVIEEAPSVGIDDATRQRLHDGAVALAAHVGYVGAGTVEFMVGDGDAATITFLEVNTRLQVEHPVTEAVTGFDLVEWQLRVAAGERLPATQDEVVVEGHAIEARLVAEDPAAGWLPSTGHLRRFEVGVDEPVRVDSGFRSGGDVSADFDSLLAKLIAHAPDRTTAARRLATACRTAVIDGVRTNAATLAGILAEPDFLAGATVTAYLDEHPGVVDGGTPAGDDLVAHLLGVVFADESRRRAADAVTGFAPSGWRNLRTRGQRCAWRVGDDEHRVEYVVTGDTADVLLGPLPAIGDDGALADDDRRRVSVRMTRDGSGTVAIEIDGVLRSVAVDLAGDRAVTASRAGTLAWDRVPRFVEPDVEAVGDGPVCPLPGTVLAVPVKAGQQVAEGDLLMVVEAMKMEHKIVAATAAEVAEVHFEVGDRVDAGELLVTLDRRDDD